MFNFIVYKALNLINNKVYIGYTKKSLDKRIAGHYYRAKTHKYHFTSALNKYSKESFEWSILGTFETQKEASDYEIKMISLFNSTNSDKGYNITAGGYLTPPLFHRKYTKHTEASKLKIREGVRKALEKRGHGVRKGSVMSTELKFRLINLAKGRSPTNKGISPTHEQWLKNKLSKVKYSKAVSAVNLESGIVLEFPSILEANKQLKVSRSTITKLCNNKIELTKFSKYSFFFSCELLQNS